MLNSKIEKILFVLFTIILYFVSVLVFPIQNSIYDYFRLVAVLTIATMIYCFYIKKRNEKILVKCHQFLESNQYDQAVIYLNSCIEKQKNTEWLKYEKLIVLGLGGRITDFKINAKGLHTKNEKIKARYNYSIELFHELFEFLQNKQLPRIEMKENQNSDIEKTIWLLLKKNDLQSSEIIEKAKQIFETKWLLFKSVSALIIALEYQKNHDLDNQEMFFAYAKKHAPSANILKCISSYEF